MKVGYVGIRDKPVRGQRRDKEDRVSINKNRRK